MGLTSTRLALLLVRNVHLECSGFTVSCSLFEPSVDHWIPPKDKSIYMPWGYLSSPVWSSVMLGLVFLFFWFNKIEFHTPCWNLPWSVYMCVCVYVRINVCWLPFRWSSFVDFVQSQLNSLLQIYWGWKWRQADSTQQSWWKRRTISSQTVYGVGLRCNVSVINLPDQAWPFTLPSIAISIWTLQIHYVLD